MENDPKRLTANDPEQLPDDGADWARVLAMSDWEALRNALADPDSQPLSPEQLARMRRSPDPRAILRRLGLTQEQFARRFQIAVGTLRDWEQGAHVPDSAATAYLRVVAHDPDAVLAALTASFPGVERAAEDELANSSRRQRRSSPALPPGRWKRGWE